MTLLSILHRYEIEDSINAALDARRAMRRIKQAIAQKAAATRHRKIINANPFALDFGRDPALALRAEPASGLVASRFDPAQGTKFQRREK